MSNELPGNDLYAYTRHSASGSWAAGADADAAHALNARSAAGSRAESNFHQPSNHESWRILWTVSGRWQSRDAFVSAPHDDDAWKMSHGPQS